jgi:alcohol dehydrogenase class IV
MFMDLSVNVFNLGSIRLVFGRNASRSLGSELMAAGYSRPLIVTDAGIISAGLLKPVTDTLSEAGIVFEVFSDVPADPPSGAIDQALAFLKEMKCDSVVAIGGGSVMDVAKGVRIMATNPGSIFDYDNSPTGGKPFLNRGMYLINIPTTAGTGSEVTPYSIITNVSENRKATIGSPLNVSDVALIDPTLTLALPPFITASTGMDALAHAIGAFTSGRVIKSEGDTTISDVTSYRAIELIAKNLRPAYVSGDYYKARSDMLMGSVLGAFASHAGSDAIHGLGHALGAVYHVPHGVACAIVMPYVIEFNIPAAPERFAAIARAFGVNPAGKTDTVVAHEGVEAIKQLMRDINIPALKDYITDDFEKFDQLCETAVKEKCSRINVRPVTKDVARDLLMKAFNQA